MEEAETAHAKRLDSELSVGNLAIEIVDPRRLHAVVCVTIPTWASEPLVDVEDLTTALDGVARVYVLPTGDLTWELTERLPPRLDVYGGATRVWWPLENAGLDPLEHPLYLIHDRSESRGIVDKIVAAFGRQGFLKVERPEVGMELAAVVTRVLPHGAELTLTGRHEAFAHASQLTQWDLPPARVVKIGQEVRVRVVEAGHRPRVGVSLLPFEPDSWTRFLELYGEGTFAEGRVVDLRPYGAMVEILPGVLGLLHKSRISDGHVSHPEDALKQGERVVVRVVRIEPAERKIDLSLRDVRADAIADVAASVHPGGPPWLPPIEVPKPDQQLEPPRAAVPEPVPEPLPEPAAVPDVEPVAVDADEVEGLQRAIVEGRELQDEVGHLFAGAQRRVEELRAEARQLRQILERDVLEVRLRVLEFAESETGDAVRSTQAALSDAKREADELRDRLAAAEQDRLALLERLKGERDRSSKAERRSERLRKELTSERARSDRLEQVMSAAGIGEDERFVAETRLAWEQSTTASDREQYPWHDPVIGPELLESIDRVEGISQDRIVRVCAQVVCGRATKMPGLEVHQLRASDAGDSPQRERADGAKAWRCSLEVNTPGGRRLHYWQLRDGRVELAKVVYHDDFSIR